MSLRGLTSRFWFAAVLVVFTVLTTWQRGREIVTRPSNHSEVHQ